MKKAYSLNRGWGATTASTDCDTENVQLLSLSQQQQQQQHRPDTEHAELSSDKTGKVGAEFEQTTSEYDAVNTPLIPEDTCVAPPTETREDDDSVGSAQNLWTTVTEFSPEDSVVKTDSNDLRLITTNTTNKEDDSGNSSMSGTGSFDGDSLSGRTRSSSSDSKSEPDLELAKVFERREKMGMDLERDPDAFGENRNVPETDIVDTILAKSSAAAAKALNETNIISPCQQQPFDPEVTTRSPITSEYPSSYSSSPSDDTITITPKENSPVRAATKCATVKLNDNDLDLNVSPGDHSSPTSLPPYNTSPDALTPLDKSRCSISSNNTSDIPPTNKPHNHTVDQYLTNKISSFPQPHTSTTSHPDALRPSPPFTPSSTNQSGVHIQPNGLQVQFYPNPFVGTNSSIAALKSNQDDIPLASNNASSNNTPYHIQPWRGDNTNTPSLSHHPNYPNNYLYQSDNPENIQPVSHPQNIDHNTDYKNGFSSQSPPLADAEIPPEFQHMPDNAPLPSASNELYEKLKILDATSSYQQTNSQRTSQNPVVMVPMQRLSTPARNTSPEGIDPKHGQFLPYSQPSQQPQQQTFINWTHSNNPIFNSFNAPTQPCTSNSQQNESNNVTPTTTTPSPPSAIESRIPRGITTITSSSFQPVPPFPQSFIQNPSQIPQDLSHSHPSQQNPQTIISSDHANHQNLPFYNLPQQPSLPTPQPPPVPQGVPLFQTPKSNQHPNRPALSVVHEDQEPTTHGQHPSTGPNSPVPQHVSNIRQVGLNGEASVPGTTHHVCVDDGNNTQAPNVCSVSAFLARQEEACSRRSLSSEPMEIITLSGTSKDCLVPQQYPPDYFMLCAFATVLNPIIGWSACLANRAAKQKYRLRQINSANNCYFFAILISAIAIFITVSAVATGIVHLSLNLNHETTPKIVHTNYSSAQMDYSRRLENCKSKLIFRDERESLLIEFYSLELITYCDLLDYPRIINAMTSFYDLHKQRYANINSSSNENVTTAEKLLEKLNKTDREDVNKHDNKENADRDIDHDDHKDDDDNNSSNTNSVSENEIRQSSTKLNSIQDGSIFTVTSPDPRHHLTSTRTPDPRHHLTSTRITTERVGDSGD